MFERLLEEIRERCESTASVTLVDRDGMVVASAGEGGESVEVLAATAMEFERRARGLTREAAAGELEGVIVQGSEAAILVQPVDEQYALVARLGPEGLIGRLRYEMRRTIPRIRAELGT